MNESMSQVVGWVLLWAAPLFFLIIAFRVEHQPGPRPVWQVLWLTLISYAIIGYLSSFVEPNYQGTHLPWAVADLIDPGLALVLLAFLVSSGALANHARWKRFLIFALIGEIAVALLLVPQLLTFVMLGGDTL